ncbi:MAG: family N-acetyltransferase [Tardiphaga sp.]|nr:family N-acetyltransferase [Tardiphaga sp.]
MIRLATRADVAAVTNLVNDAYAIYIARNGKVPGPMRDDYHALIRDRRVNVLEDDSAILGVLVMIPETDAMLLDNIAVAPGAQRRGVGKTLMRFAEDQARAASLKAIRLYTQDIMTENIALYRRLGYVETHRGEAIGLMRVYMKKILT